MSYRNINIHYTNVIMHVERILVVYGSSIMWEKNIKVFKFSICFFLLFIVQVVKTSNSYSTIFFGGVLYEEYFNFYSLWDMNQYFIKMAENSDCIVLRIHSLLYDQWDFLSCFSRTGWYDFIPDLLTFSGVNSSFF